MTKLTASCPLVVAGVNLDPGDEFEIDESSAAKMISRKQAKPTKAKRKKQKAEATSEE